MSICVCVGIIIGTNLVEEYCTIYTQVDRIRLRGRNCVIDQKNLFNYRGKRETVSKPSVWGAICECAVRAVLCWWERTLGYTLNDMMVGQLSVGGGRINVYISRVLRWEWLEWHSAFERSPVSRTVHGFLFAKALTKLGRPVGHENTCGYLFLFVGKRKARRFPIIKTEKMCVDHGTGKLSAFTVNSFPRREQVSGDAKDSG